MSFLLDTDICSAFLKGDRIVWPRFMQYAGQLHVSAITVGELFTWVSRKNASIQRKQSLAAFLNDVTILDVNQTVGAEFGRIRAELLDAGQATPDLDLLIAATALVHKLTLVTHNSHDFQHVPNLLLDDWLAP